MDSTGFCLPSNWSIEEWPDVIAVTHEGTCEGLRVYVPERTCKIEPTTCKNEMFIERIHEYECMSCNELVPMYYDDGKPNYCPWCGAKVVE